MHSETAKQVATENLNLARWIIFRYRQRWAMVEFDELLSEATIMLMRCAKSHDPAKGRFSTYAHLAIFRHLDRISGEQAAVHRREKWPGSDKKGRDVLPELAVAPQPFGGEGVGIDLQRVATLMRRLPVKQQTILKLFYGLGGAAPQSMEEIGRAVGLCRIRVSLLHCSAIATLRKQFEGRDHSQAA